MLNTSIIFFAAATGCIVYLLVLNNRLKKSLKKNKFFHKMVKSLPIVLYLKDTNGNIISATDELAKVTGFSHEELLTKNVKDIYPEKFLEAIKRQDLEIINKKKPIDYEKPIDIVGNTTHWYQVIKSPVFDSENNVIGITVFYKNIDKEKEIEESKSTFMATLTHDLKTPINAQNNILNLLYEGTFGELNNDQKEMIRLTSCSNKYMADIVFTILDTYQYENGFFNLHYQTFNIIELINSLCKGAESLANEKNFSIQFSHASTIPDIYADRFQIKRVIMNFLSNAITYGFKNTTININLTACGDSIELSVTNISKQIPQNELAVIFDKFKKTKISNFNKASTGLGLYLSKEIINMHNGEIFAKSFEDGTCVFGFKLPIKVKANAEILGEVKV